MRKGIILLVIMLTLAGCSVSVAGTPVPPGTLVYTGPVELKLQKGQTLPGTRIQYVSNGSEGAQVSIDGQTSTRKVGDSVAWQGEMVPGVVADVSTRIVLINDTQLNTVGTIELAVTGANPQAGTVDTSAAARYKVPVVYKVNRGDTIPGTRIVYEGMDGQRAKLGNVEGDAFRTIGQTITWSGKLRDRVWLQLDLRTVVFSADSLNVTGTATVYLAP